MRRSDVAARLGRDAGWYALLLPAFLLLSVFYITPILQVLAISFLEPEPGFGNYERIATNPSVQRVLLTTLRICSITTALALLLGYGLSYAITLASEKARRWWLLCVLVPLWISVLVRAFAWVTLLRRQGPRPLALAGRVFDLHPAIETALCDALPAGTPARRLTLHAHHTAARLAAARGSP